MSGQNSIEGAMLLKEIQNRGYEEFDHGIPSEWIDNLVEKYAELTLAHPNPNAETMDLMIPFDPTPDEVADENNFEDGSFSHYKWLGKQLDNLDRTQDTQKEWHKYRTNVQGVGKPDGYTNRSFQSEVILSERGIDLREDPKEYYHHTPTHMGKMQRLHRELGWGALPPEVLTLDLAFGKIHTKARELTVKICASIEDVHPEIKDIITSESLDTSPIRLLFYHPSDSEQLGAGHYDKSVGTLQLAESHEGLRISTVKGQPLQGVVREPEKAVYFPGWGLQNRVGEDTPYQPGYHDIVRIDRLNPGRTIPEKAAQVCVRYAVIFFSNGANYVMPDKSLMHQQ